MNPAESVRRTEAEIRRAKAEALGRVGERLDAALAELAALDRRLDGMPAGDPRLTREIDARNRLRSEAVRLVQQLVIQREALGLVRHTTVHEQYPVPPRRTPSGTARSSS